MDGRGARREEPPTILLAFGVIGLRIALTGKIVGQVSGLALVVAGSFVTLAAGLTFCIILVERLLKRENPSQSEASSLSIHRQCPQRNVDRRNPPR